MEIKKLAKIYKILVDKIESEPEKVIEYFNEQWDKLTFEEKEVLKPLINRFFEISYRDESTPIERLMYITEILVAIGIESEHLNRTVKLTFKEEVSDIQIVHLFYELKSCQHITNTNDEIAAFLTNAFNIKNSTALTYLNNPKRFVKVKPLIK